MMRSRILLTVVLTFNGKESFGAEQEGRELVKNMPIEVLPKGYVSSERCKACHIEEHSSWKESYHRTMTQVASSKSVRGPFNGMKWNLHGGTYRAFKRAGRFWADLPGTNHTRLEKEIVMVTHHPHQQEYLQRVVNTMIQWYLTIQEPIK